MTRTICLSVLGALVALGAPACSSNTSGTGGGGQGTLALSVGALTEADVSDACYSITVDNGSGVVWSQDSLCSSDFGSGTSISYVGICDATTGTNTVTIDLVSLLDNDGLEVPGSEYVNPCTAGAACSKEITCIANADVQVDFSLVILTSGDAGFVDITVDIDQIECSAKLDCLDSEGQPLQLVDDPATGERGDTILVALTCSGGGCDSDGSYLYTTDVVLVCDEGTAVISPVGPGQATIVSDPADLVFAAVVYSGAQPLGAGGHNNLGIGFNGGTNCTVTLTATGSATALAGPAPHLLPAGHPAIEWNVPVTGGAGELVCSAHPLGSPEVAVVYNEGLPLDHEIFFETDVQGCFPTLECPCWAGSNWQEWTAAFASRTDCDGGDECFSNVSTPSADFTCFPDSGQTFVRFNADDLQCYCQGDAALFVTGCAEFGVGLITPAQGALCVEEMQGFTGTEVPLFADPCGLSDGIIGN